MSAVATPSLRWSSARSCPRKAVLEETTEPERDWDDWEQRIFFRGRQVGRDYALMLANGSGGRIWVESGEDYWVPPNLRAPSRDQAEFVCELRVPWLAGTGHVDVYAVATDTVIEVLSSRYETQAHSKLLQATGYANQLPECKAVCVVIVDPSTLEESRVIVLKGSPEWDALLVEVEERLGQIAVWKQDGTIPPRVCQRPEQARGMWCRHSGVCFDGWEATPLDQITDPAVVDLAGQVVAVKEKERAAKAEYEALERERKEIETLLADHVEPGKWQVGSYTINRSPRRRENFSLKLARQDSRLDSSLLDEFTSVSTWDVWTVAQDGSGDIDFGEEVPF